MDIKNYTVPDFRGNDTRDIVEGKIEAILDNIRKRGIFFIRRKDCVTGYDADEFCYVGRCSGDTPDVDGMAYVYSEDELAAGDIVNVEIVDASDYDVMCKCVDIS